MKQVRISELKSHLAKHLRAAEAGDSFEVMDRARAIARVVPIGPEGDGLEVVAAETSFASVRSIRLPRVSPSVSSLEALRQERGHR